MTKRQNRLVLILGALIVLGAATALILNAFQSSLVFFFTPTEVSQGQSPENRTFRVGGIVQMDSIRRGGAQGMAVNFVVTDGAAQVPVSYTGILPDLFQEGKGVVAQGRLNEQGHFVAEEVLAKHDENYMPPEAAYAVDQANKDAAAAKAAQAGAAKDATQ